jgi:hypothetical protein
MGMAPEYEHHWTELVTPNGMVVPCLRARRRTSGNACSGWPSPMTGSPETDTYDAAGNTDSSRRTVELVGGWVTPTSRDHKMSTHRDRAKGEQLDGQAHMAGWATPQTTDAASAGSRNTETSKAHPGYSLTDQARGDSGTGRSGSPVETGKRGALNPALSRWLMGYPPAWCRAAIRAKRKHKTPARQELCASADTETP